MLVINKNKVLRIVQALPHQLGEFKDDLIYDVMYKHGYVATEYIVKNGKMTFTDKRLLLALQKTLKQKKITKNQFTELSTLLVGNNDGAKRVANFITKERFYQFV